VIDEAFERLRGARSRIRRHRVASEMHIFFHPFAGQFVEWPLLTRSRPETKPQVTSGNESERNSSSDSKSPGREAGSIPGSSTEDQLVKAKSLGQFYFSSISHQHRWSKLAPWRRYGPACGGMAAPTSRCCIGSTGSSRRPRLRTWLSAKKFQKLVDQFGPAKALAALGADPAFSAMAVHDWIEHHINQLTGLKHKARQRIEEAADRMACELLRMATVDNVADSLKLTAIPGALECAGLATKNAVEVEVGPTKPYQVILETIEEACVAER
jgi:hypothetical protein